jgi:hypothetical protein
MKHRIIAAGKSKRRGQLWDHFSWYAIKNPEMLHDIEVLMLRILPPNLRSLTRQGGSFAAATEVTQDEDIAVAIARKIGRRTRFS